MPHRNGPDVFFSFPGRKGSVCKASESRLQLSSGDDGVDVEATHSVIVPSI
jgi:hypothetical protein